MCCKYTFISIYYQNKIYFSSFSSYFFCYEYAFHGVIGQKQVVENSLYLEFTTTKIIYKILDIYRMDQRLGQTPNPQALTVEGVL